MHVYIKIMGYRIPTYGLLISSSVIIANLFVIFCAIKKYKGEIVEDFLILEAYTFLGAFGGAKILYLVVSYKEIQWEKLFEVPYINEIMQGGFVFYGGLLGGIAACFFAGKLHHISANVYLQHYIFAIPFIHSFGRIGCFMAGCCYGIPYSGWGAVVYPAGSGAPAGIPLFPVQLAEALLLLALSGLLLFLQLHGRKRDMVSIYLLFYGTIRFVLEFLRFDEEERGKIGMLSVSQVISLALIGISIVRIKNKREQKFRCDV